MSSFAKRIIPCLDVDNGRVVKGINFVGLRDAGDPVEVAKRYNNEGADEITFLDITASHENRGTIVDIVKEVAKEIFIPLTVGGGIRKLDDIYSLLNVGCDKVSINSSAVSNPDLINQSAKRFGSQCIVTAIDVKKVHDGTYHVFVKGGREDTGLDAVEWAKEVYTEIMKKDEQDTSSFLYLAESVSSENYLNDKKWAKVLYKKALEKAETPNDFYKIAISMIDERYLNDKNTAKFLFDKVVELSNNGDNLNVKLFDSKIFLYCKNLYRTLADLLLYLVNIIILFFEIFTIFFCKIFS